MNSPRRNPSPARLYNALWYAALPFALIGSARADPQAWRERLGRCLEAHRSGGGTRRVWAHAASVGEVEALMPILVRLEGAVGRLELHLTTMTASGREAARRRMPQLASCRLAPFDFTGSVRAFLRHLQPHLILVAETELWPNFFIEGARHNARIAIVNGRISPRSMPRYRLVSRTMARALACADRILVQTEADAARFQELGAGCDRVVVTGNTKFDLAASPPPTRPALVEFLRDRPVLIAGSTAQGEERLVLEAWRGLATRFPHLALVIAPRHLERVPEVEAELHRCAAAFIRATGLNGDRPRETRILLLDTLGELRGLYRYATIAFVGGSIAPLRGGQNLGEPAAAGVPVLFGPHFENQQLTGDALLGAGGGFVVANAPTLEAQCVRLLADPDAHREAGRAAREVIEQRAQGAAVTVAHLLPLLDAHPANRSETS
ncbi:MAG TPA: 3-deoxy-D-manno-octulosonic acid transferase [Candidatus Binataceae bacterium]|nr:3-deoxy-D-manno-octulosonic acid transferase [Candidatus Binataceae bacterium]